MSSGTLHWKFLAKLFHGSTLLAASQCKAIRDNNAIETRPGRQLLHVRIHLKPTPNLNTIS